MAFNGQAPPGPAGELKRFTKPLSSGLGERDRNKGREGKVEERERNERRKGGKEKSE